MKSEHCRNVRGQSMVEYALGIGCVAAVAMVALSATGHISGHIFHSVETAINYNGNKSEHPEELVNLTSQPWNIQ